jgi:hypothetical protein
MLPFGVIIPATVPHRSEIPEGLMNYPVYHNTSSLEQNFEERQMITGHYYKSAAKVAKGLCLLQFYFIKRLGK